MNRRGDGRQALVRPERARRVDATLGHADSQHVMRKILLISLFLLSIGLRAEAQKVPPEKELKTLVRDSLLAFNDAVQEKNFAGFYKHELATAFRDQMSLEKFNTAFQPFLEKGYDISNIKNSDPVFDAPPAIDDDGVLAVTGSYATRPNKVTFKLKYLQEKSAWKLVGINVQVVPFVEKTGPVPSEAEAKRLALDSLLGFNKALRSKSFDSFYAQTAKLWQAETTPAKLKEIFQPFIAQDVNISGIADVEPAFDSKPAVNDDSLLVLKGSYPAKPNQVLFELKYVYEEGDWKLVGINVNLKKNTDTSTEKALKKPDADDDE